ncbi:SgcJ/EcaC family oxidoreductase [Plantactinospora sp. WMMB782]|uniref:SgcJ/EcaC family oxidoreductase n=1 Tax=Plantactinospora sp. WMMB782 TaxID=3404121 RepID=UPI003B9555EC
MQIRRAALGSFAAVLLAGVVALTGCGPGTSDGKPGLTASTPPGTPTQDAPTATDEAAVRRLLDQINDAWARGDAAAYASFHAPDADLVDFRGTHVVGREGIVGLLQPAFETVLRNTRVEARIVDLRFLSPAVAIFHTEGKIVPTGDESVQTFVATKGADGWLIAAFQNTRIQAGQE